jgi:hypothetical protein
MTKINCGQCGCGQDTRRLDDQHTYCPHHTGDDNEAGVGLVCLCWRDPKTQRGVCPDCGTRLAKLSDGQMREVTKDGLCLPYGHTYNER